MDLSSVENVPEDIHVHRTPGDSRRRARGLALALGRGATTGALALLGRVLQDQPCRALGGILKHKGHVFDPAPQVGVPQEHLAPQLGHLLGRVAVRVAQAEVADDDALDVVVGADCERRPQLVLGHLPLVAERVLGAVGLQLGPAHGRHGHDGEGSPVLWFPLLVFVVRASEHHWRKALSQREVY